MLGDPLAPFCTSPSQRFVNTGLHAPRIWIRSDAISTVFLHHTGATVVSNYVKAQKSHWGTLGPLLHGSD